MSETDQVEPKETASEDNLAAPILRRKRGPNKPKPESAAESLILLQLQTRNQMLDPSGIILKPMAVTPVEKITPFLRVQIAAGLVKVIG